MGLFHNIVRLSGWHGPDRSEGRIGDWTNIPVVVWSGNELTFDLFLTEKKASRTKLLWDSRYLPRKRDQAIYFEAEDLQVIGGYTIEMICHV